MSQTRSSNHKVSQGEVNLAKASVSSSVHRLEDALDHLAIKVEESAHKIQHVKDLAHKPQEFAENIKSQALIAKDKALVLVDKFRANPATPLMTVGLIAAAFWIYYTAPKEYRYTSRLDQLKSLF